MGARIKSGLPNAKRLTRTIREDRLDANLNRVSESKINLFDRGERNRQKREMEKMENETDGD